MVYYVETCISNLPGGQRHYETLNHEMLVLKKFRYHLLSFTKGYQAIVALSALS
jgi:hypothetical protein